MEVLAAGARPFVVDDGAGHVSPYSNSHNGTSPSVPPEEDDMFQGPSERTANMVGLFAALCAGAVIIVGIAFVISKIRRRSRSEDDDTGTGTDNPAFQVSITEKDEKTNLSTIENNSSQPDIPRYDIKYIYTISGLPPEKPKNCPKRILARLCCAKPESPNIHEAIRRDLSKVYVY